MSARASIALGIAVLAAGAALVFAYDPGSANSASSSIGGHFQLVEAKGQRRFTDADLRGKAAAMFFGFTHCPDVCPTALSVAGKWLKGLGPDASKLNFVFVSVDPERDTPTRLAQYLQAFDPRIVGLTGTRKQIDEVLQHYHIFAQKRPNKSGEGYSYDHTALIQLFDAKGQFTGTLDFEDPQGFAVAKLRALIHGKPQS